MGDDNAERDALGKDVCRLEAALDEAQKDRDDWFRRHEIMRADLATAQERAEKAERTLDAIAQDYPQMRHSYEDFAFKSGALWSMDELKAERDSALARVREVEREQENLRLNTVTELREANARAEKWEKEARENYAVAEQNANEAHREHVRAQEWERRFNAQVELGPLCHGQPVHMLTYASEKWVPLARAKDAEKERDRAIENPGGIYAETISEWRTRAQTARAEALSKLEYATREMLRSERTGDDEFDKGWETALKQVQGEIRALLAPRTPQTQEKPE